jgi:hypothetical protein
MCLVVGRKQGAHLEQQQLDRHETFAPGIDRETHGFQRRGAD